MILRHEPGHSRLLGNDAQREEAEALARETGLSLAFAYEGEPVHPTNRSLGVTLTWLAFAGAGASASLA